MGQLDFEHYVGYKTLTLAAWKPDLEGARGMRKTNSTHQTRPQGTMNGGRPVSGNLYLCLRRQLKLGGRQINFLRIFILLYFWNVLAIYFLLSGTWVLFAYFWHRVSCRSCWFWIYYVTKESFGILIFLHPPPEYWVNKHTHRTCFTAFVLWGIMCTQVVA